MEVSSLAQYLRLSATREGRAEAGDQEADRGRDRRPDVRLAKWFPESANESSRADARAAAAPAFRRPRREWLENKKAWFAPATTTTQEDHRG